MPTLDETIQSLAGLNLQGEQAYTDLLEHQNRCLAALADKVDEVLGTFQTFLPILQAQLEYAHEQQQKFEGYELVPIPRRTENSQSYSLHLRMFGSAAEEVQKTTISESIILRKRFLRKPQEKRVKIKEVVKGKTYSLNIFLKLSICNSKHPSFLEHKLYASDPCFNISMHKYSDGEENLFFSLIHHSRNMIPAVSSLQIIRSSILRNYRASMDENISVFSPLDLDIKKNEKVDEIKATCWLPYVINAIPELTVDATRNVLEKLSRAKQRYANTQDHIEQIAVADLENIKEQLRK